MTSPLDDAFKALASPDRRRLLLALAEQRPQANHSLDYLEDVPTVSGENTESIHLRMHHHHLPMLETGGFIEWHKDDRTITKGPNFTTIWPLLDVLDEESRRAETNGV